MKFEYLCCSCMKQVDELTDEGVCQECLSKQTWYKTGIYPQPVESDKLSVKIVSDGWVITSNQHSEHVRR